MKRGLKNILIIILILILTIGTFNCAKKILIRNIFDEMYFGTKDIWGGHLTSTSWNNMSGLAKMNDSSKYEIPNIIRTYFSKLYLTENEIFSVLWRMDIKQLQFIYAVYFQKSEEINEIILGQHRINGRIHIGGHAFCENQQDAPCFYSQGRTDSSCQAGPVSQNQIR